MKTSYLTRGGILTSLSVILVYVSTIAPTNKLFLLVVASSLIPLAIISTNIKTSIGIYLSTSLLILLLIGFKSSVFLYIVFFGIYGLIKLLIEKIDNLPIELILKFMFFIICLCGAFFVFSTISPINNLSNFPFSLPILIIVAVLSFFLYDYALTLFIHKVSKFFIKNS